MVEICLLGVNSDPLSVLLRNSVVWVDCIPLKKKKCVVVLTLGTQELALFEVRIFKNNQVKISSLG